VLDINPGANGSNLYDFVEFGGYVYLAATDGSNGQEIWRTNGTTTTMFADIYSGSNSSYADGFTVFGDYLYFQANDGVVNDELWRTDGTTLGTELVADILTGAGGSDPEYFTPLGDYLYFSAYDGDEDYVYRTDGTVTEQVPFPDNTEQNISCDCYDTNIATAGGRLFTTVYSSATGYEFAWLTESTYVLPETNRGGGVGTAWTIALSALALVTLAAGVGLRRRAGVAQR
jgi:ELWxxDGT repeat protein